MIEVVGDASESGERDYTALDGYEELSQEAQVKIRKALEQGHVDDEDWKGVSRLMCSSRGDSFIVYSVKSKSDWEPRMSN